MVINSSCGKISGHHFQRKAVVYLRQSSEKQVRQNTESARLQYGLTDRARSLGWSQVEVVDADLGSSAGMGAERRAGFERLIAAVAIGEVGIILSREASRLSRTDKDWCRLLEVCQVFDTLIGDDERVYDLSLMDDQLVLGIKATMSVVELKILHARMQAGRDAKAKRGELEVLLPPGYVRDLDGRTVKDPDSRVRDAIELVFAKFRQLWSVRQTFLWFHGEGMELPVNKMRGGRMRIAWQLPSCNFVKDVLKNPCYAGVFVWGRRQTRKVLENGQIRKKLSPVMPWKQCRVFLSGHHEGYIDWPTFEENQRMMRGNQLNAGLDGSVGAARAGQGLLAGILRCGRCGRILYVKYWGKSGTAARYACNGDFPTGGRYCLAFPGATVDRRIGEELLKVLSPLGMRASLEALDRRRLERQERIRPLEAQLRQAEYEVMRAFEQYDQVDARNRQVAAELEARWNLKLEEERRIKAALADAESDVDTLDERERAAVLALGEDFRGVWEAKDCPIQLKKKIVRTVIEELTANLDDAGGVFTFVIRWKGGCHTAFSMAKPAQPSGRRTADDDLEIIRKLAARYGDGEIARVLNKLGRRTGMGKRWSEQRVARVRHQHLIRGQRDTKPDAEIMNMREAARHCGVSETTIKRLVDEGILPKEQIVPWAAWEIRKTDLDSQPVAGIVERLRRSGKLILHPHKGEGQASLFDIVEKEQRDGKPAEKEVMEE